jgi:hypothetical protein
MTGVHSETSYDLEIPYSIEPNRKSLLGLLPASTLLFLSYMSFVQTNVPRDEYTSLVYVSAAAGLSMFLAAVIGYLSVDVWNKSGVATSLVFGWAVFDALFGAGFFFGAGWPSHVWFGYGYAVIVLSLMQMGTTFIVWESLTGVFGAYAKAIAVAMGFAAIAASIVVCVALGMTYYY